ncbi:MAG: hypothetical protein GY757_41330, partial [bacterium]|nr:hypothetical protein [bacterium]
ANYDGDIRKRDRIPALTGERIQGEHAWRVMAAYEQRFSNAPETGFFRRFKKSQGITPELSILYIMGLFDRPADRRTIDALIAKPIKGLTSNLSGLSEDVFNSVFTTLKVAGLLSRETPRTLSSHPLVREYFGIQFKRHNPEGWQGAHKRLYEYYKQLPEKEKPDTLAEMEPLFAAVVHGCRAGMHQEALKDVFWKRIYRGEENFLVKKLGAFGSFL